MVAVRGAVDCGRGERGLFDVVLLVTIYLVDVVENAHEDILAAMRVAVACILCQKLPGRSHIIPVPKKLSHRTSDNVLQRRQRFAVQ